MSPDNSASPRQSPVTSPRIKVCGVRRPADVVMLAEEGVDTVGINLVSTSPRSVLLDEAQRLADLAHEVGLRVAIVVMNPTGEALRKILDTVPMDYIQMHGREPPELAQLCGATAIIKSVSWSGRGEERQLARQWRDALAPLQEGTESGRADAVPPVGSDAIVQEATTAHLQAMLVDAYAPVTGGGTGRTARWDLLVPRPNEFRGIDLLLAGGLRPDNVAAAIREVHPDGVDTASGVEDSPGVKSRDQVRRFVAQVRRAWTS
ncbi:MAG: phosphoribosylanthranilate isomerase [Planctomycetota bacterium]|nr:MAG: phosphoribosylanthranilate isomerase [Planctomycetota bacterium]